MITKRLDPHRMDSRSTGSKTLVWLLVFGLIFQPVLGFAQRSSKGRTQRGRGLSTRGQTARDEQKDLFQMDVGRIGKAAYDSVIRSGRYIVGPGDTFVILLDGGEEPEVFEVLIGAEGRLVIPYVGAVEVAGLSLSEAHEQIKAGIKNRFRHLDIDVTLTRLRSFPVDVLGEVQFPGSYLVEGVEQVSDLVSKAGGLLSGPDGRASQRNVRIHRVSENGISQPTGQKADLALWRITGDIGHNPFILDGDQIYVPTLRDSVSISGSVQQPGNYEFVSGDRVSNLVMLAGGLTADSAAAAGELLRLSREEQSEKRVQVFLHEALNGDSGADLKLQRDDKLYVEGLKPRITVEGEVYFPGSFPLEADLTLRDLIQKAGGFTPHASLAQASVFRQVQYEGGQDRANRLKSLSPAILTPDQRTYLSMKTQQERARLPVDFVALFVGNDASQNITLHADDIVRVPKLVPSILVTGFVITPGAIPFDSTYAVRTYIDRAGGYNERAKSGDVIVIKASTGNWIDASKVNRLDPGDEIYVPGKMPGETWRLFRETLLVLTQVATLVIAVRSIR